MSRHWTIRPKPLALVSPGRTPLTIPVREIGRGMFSVALRGSEGFMTETVFLITFRGVKEKDILVSLSDYSPHLPQIEKVGRLKAGKGTWNLYQSPFYTKRLSTSNRKIVRTMERCFDKLDKDKRFFLKPGKVMYPDMAHPLMKAIRDCAESGRVPYPILAAPRHDHQEDAPGGILLRHCPTQLRARPTGKPHSFGCVCHSGRRTTPANRQGGLCRGALARPVVVRGQGLEARAIELRGRTARTPDSPVDHTPQTAPNHRAK